MSYSIEVYRGDVPAEHNLLDFGAYVVMFPQLIAGPIVKYRDVSDRLHVLKGRVTMDRDVYKRQLLQHALRARFPARQLGRGMQRMAQRHSLFVQFIIHSAASPKFMAAAITVCQHFSTRRPL